jgi:mRNA-degrading endonuclease RelE of RelBE toxin-antitoxin system
VTTEYGLHISDDIEKQIRRCRAPVRAAIKRHLREIAAGAGKARSGAKAPTLKEPPLRFYVYEGHRIAYQLDSASRRVVVTDIELLAIH